MKVQMLYTLAAVLAHVGHHTVAVVTAQFLAQAGNGGKHMSQQLAVLLGERGSRVHMLLGNHQKVNRRLGINVVERKDLVILEQLIRGDLALGDFAEQAIH